MTDSEFRQPSGGVMGGASIICAIALGAAALCIATAGCEREGEAVAPVEIPPTAYKRTLENGLVISELVDGAGEPCSPDAVVEVEFTATLEDGRVFDSTEERRGPLRIPLNRPSTIQGLRQGIAGMRPGGQRRLEIPWHLAYGESGRDPVPPMADLTFVVTLVRIIEDAPQQEAATRGK